MTTGTINPYDRIYSENKENMIDYDGNIQGLTKKTTILLDDVQISKKNEVSALISNIKSDHIDKIINDHSSTTDSITECFYKEDYIITNLEDKLKLNRKLSKLKIAIGTYDCMSISYLDEYSSGTGPTEACTSILDTIDGSFPRTETFVDRLIDSINSNYSSNILDDPSVLSLEALICSTTFNSSTNKVNIKYLSKIQKISEKAAEKTVNTTTQYYTRAVDPTLVRFIVVMIEC